MGWGDIGSVLFAMAAPQGYKAYTDVMDRSQYKDDLSKFQADPSYMPDPSVYHNPSIGVAALDAFQKKGASTLLDKFAQDYEKATGTPDARFLGDAESRAELQKAGVGFPSLTNPYVSERMKALETQGAQEQTAKAASTGDPWALANIAADKDLASSFHLAQQGADIPIKREQAQQKEDREQAKADKKEADDAQKTADQQEFDRMAAGIGGSYTPAQPILDGKAPTGPNLGVNGLDYSDNQGKPTFDKARIMPYEEAKKLLMQAASDYPKADFKTALASLEKQYKETYTAPRGEASPTNWMGEASHDTTQLQLAADAGSPIARRLLDNMKQRELEIAKAKAEDRRMTIIQHPTPTRGNLNINGISDDDAAILSNAIASGQLDASKVNSRTGKLMVQMLKNNPNLDFNNSAATAGALKKIESQRSAVQTFERTAQKNFDLVEKLFNQNPQSSVLVLNQLKNNFNTKFTGDPNTVALGRAMRTALMEYAKVVTGSTGGAAVSDSARKEVETLLSQSDRPETFRASLNNHRLEMRNRMESFNEEIDALKTGRGGNVRQNVQTAPSGGRFKIISVK